MIKKTKKITSILAVCCVLVCFIITSCAVSYAKFGVANPFSTGMALVKVMFTHTKYVEVQKYPRVIIAKSDNAEHNLVEYMKNRGFNEYESERMGALMIFGNEVSNQYVLFSVNGYFSKWQWRE